MLPGKTYKAADIVAMLRRRWLLLLVPPLVTLFGALLYSARLPNVFESNTLVAIVPQRVPDAFVRTTVTLRTEDRIDAIATQLTSRTTLEQIINEFDLYPAERERLPLEDVIGIMHRSIDYPLEPQRRGARGLEPPHAFRVVFRYSDPVIAARVAQRLATLFVDFNARDRGVLAEATNTFLDDQLAQARERLEAQERRMEEFRQRHGQELPTQMSSNMQAIQGTQFQIQSLAEALARDRDRKMLLERLYGEAQNEPVATLRQTPSTASTEASGPQGVSARERLESARANLARLELRLTAEHPDVRSARTQIAELEPQAAAEAAARSAGAGPALAAVSPEEASRRERLSQMRAEIESLDRQTAFKESEQRRLREVLAEYQRRVEAVPGIESEWSVLTRDYNTQQASYNELVNKSEAARVALNLEKRQIGENFRILDPATPAGVPISPLRSKITGIGLAIGLFLGIAIAALIELKDSSFRSEADVLDVLALPVLAVVPHVETGTERTRRLRRVAIAAGVAGCAVLVAGYVFWEMRLWAYIA